MQLDSSFIYAMSFALLVFVMLIALSLFGLVYAAITRYLKKPNLFQAFLCAIFGWLYMAYHFITHRSEDFAGRTFKALGCILLFFLQWVPYILPHLAPESMKQDMARKLDTIKAGRSDDLDLYEAKGGGTQESKEEGHDFGDELERDIQSALTKDVDSEKEQDSSSETKEAFKDLA